MVGAESSEGAIDRIAIDDVTNDVGCDRRICAGQDTNGALPFAAGLAVDAADQDPMQPRLETVEVSQATQVSPGLDERLLDRIVGQVAVPEHQLGDVEEPADRRGGELGKGLPIAPSRPLDQLAPYRHPVPRSRQCAPCRPRGGGAPESVPSWCVSLLVPDPSVSYARGRRLIAPEGLGTRQREQPEMAAVWRWTAALGLAALLAACSAAPATPPGASTAAPSTAAPSARPETALPADEAICTVGSYVAALVALGEVLNSGYATTRGMVDTTLMFLRQTRSRMAALKELSPAFAERFDRALDAYELVLEERATNLDAIDYANGLGARIGQAASSLKQASDISGVVEECPGG